MTGSQPAAGLLLVQVEKLTLDANHVADPAVTSERVTHPGSASQSSARPGSALTVWKPSAVALWMPPGTKPTKARHNLRLLMALPVFLLIPAPVFCFSARVIGFRLALTLQHTKSLTSPQWLTSSFGHLCYTFILSCPHDPRPARVCLVAVDHHQTR